MANFGLLLVETMNPCVGFFCTNRQNPCPTRARENVNVIDLKKIYLGNSEKNAPKFFGWVTFGVYPLRGSGPQILFLIIIALGALRQTNFVWGESAHIWGSYGGLKIAYFGLFYLENLNSDFGFLNADRQSPGPNRDPENLKKIAIPRFEKNAPKFGGCVALLGFTPLGGPDFKSYF